MQRDNLAKQAALVTGASSGIGQGITERLAVDGFSAEARKRDFDLEL